MQCPLCPQSQLTMSTREGIEIDYCPQCRGVWLDRGELDKIIERSSSLPSEAVSNQPAAWRDTAAPQQNGHREQPRYYKAREDDDDDRGRYRDDRGDYRHGRKKRGGFLGELFDFD